MWNDPERAPALGQARAQLENVVVGLDELKTGLGDAGELLEMAEDEDDEDTVKEVVADLKKFESQVAGL